MKSDNLIDSIVKDAQKQEKEIIETAKKEAEQKAKIIVDSAKKDAKQAEKDAIEKAKEKKNEKIYKYEQDAKNIVLAGKKKLLCQLFEEATENIKNIENPKRKDILKNLLGIAKKELEDIAVVYTSVSDLSELKDIEKNIEIQADKTIDFGIIAENKDKTIMLDLSLNSLADMLEKKIMFRIMKKLE